MVKLLIVDDEKMICEEFRETLEHEGYEVDCAFNGKDGLHKVQNNHYSLVFVDFAMPFMDGKKVLERIRHFSRVPVAVITGFVSASKEKEILSLGALTCLKKPLDLDRVKTLIHTVAVRRLEPHHS
ncbi:MAG TPA: response regulator [Candidatus Omnitrophota bacterium]|nr:response regulator [Candidatus Omnitrophota bacterium]HPS37020.1 response regulator [Candidatus Omnitrophota bacterium]